MPNKSIQTQTAQDLLENAQVYLESLEGTLIRLFVSCEQHNIYDEKAKAMLSVCEMLASAALEDIESASAKTILNISMIVSRATGILYTLEELSHFDLAKGHTLSTIYGLSLVCDTLKELLETAVNAVMNAGDEA